MGRRRGFLENHMKFRLLAAIFALGVCAFSACSSDGNAVSNDDAGEPSATTTTQASSDRDRDALVAAMSSSPGFADDVVECLVDTTIITLTDDGYEIATDGGEFSEYSELDLAAIIASYDDCIDQAALTELFVEHVFFGALSDVDSVCVVDGLVAGLGGVGEVLVNLQNSDGEGRYDEQLAQSLPTCLDEDESVEFVRSRFVAQGADDLAADCMIGRLAKQYSGQQMITQALTGDQVFSTAVQSAAEACLS